MLGANRLRINPAAATTDPAIVTGRLPYLFVRKLTKGAEKVSNFVLITVLSHLHYMANDPVLSHIVHCVSYRESSACVHAKRLADNKQSSIINYYVTILGSV